MAVQEHAEEKPFVADRVATIAAGHAVHDTYAAFLSSLLPVLIQNFSLIKTQAGLLSVFTQAPSLIQPYIGYLADRVNLRWMVILAPGITATMMSLLGIAPSYAVAAFLLLIVGISSAAFHAIAPVMAGRLSGERLGLGMSFWMVGGELGRTLGPLVIVTTLQYVPIQGTPLLMVAGWLTSIILYSRLRDVSNHIPHNSQSVSWLSALKTMRPVLLPLSGVMIFRSFAAIGVVTFLPTFITEQGGNLWFAGASLSLLEAAGVAGAFLGGSISDRIGRRPILSISLLGTAGFLAAFLLVNNWLQFPVLLGLGFTMLSVTPAMMAAVQESFPDSRALANGVFMAVNFLATSVAVILVGAAGDLFGLRTAYWICSGIALIGLPFVFLLPKKK